MTKQALLNMRVATAEKQRWQDVAASQGIVFSKWVRRCLNEEVERHDAEEGDVAAKRNERQLLRDSMYPQRHPQGKKSYKSDWR